MATSVATTPSDRRARIAPVSDGRSYWMGVAVGICIGVPLGILILALILAAVFT